jgi:hypothetical protein
VSERSRLDDALAYASIGWKVFPIVRETKRPATVHGHLDATDDPETISQWWGTEGVPDANVAVSLRASGLIAVDLDPRNGGDEQLEALEEQMTPLPRDAVQGTPSGGRHFIMRDRAERQPRGKVKVEGEAHKGLDVKCRGYVLLEGSTRADGRAYEWIALDPESIPEIPDAWLDALYHPVIEATDDSAPNPIGHLEVWRETVDPAGGGAGLPETDAERLRDHLRSLGDRGQGGSTTFRAIAAIHHDYGLSVEDGWSYLLEWNASSTKPHPERELERQLQRVASREMIGRRGRARRQGAGGARLSLGQMVERAGAIRGAVEDDPEDEEGPGHAKHEPAAAVAVAAETDPDTGGLGPDRGPDRGPTEPDPLAAALAAGRPRQSQVAAHLRVVSEKWARSTKPGRREAAPLVKAALTGRGQPAGDEDRATWLARTATALLYAAPDGTADDQVAALLPCEPNEAALAVAAARECPVISIEPERRPPPPDPSRPPPAGPSDDEDLLSRLTTREDGRPEPTATNVNLILRYGSGTREGTPRALRWDEMSKRVTIASGALAGVPPNDLPWAVVGYLEKWGVRGVGRGDAGAAILAVARQHGSFSPVRDYLLACAAKWDGDPRIDTWLRDYLRADPTPMLDRYGAMFLLGAAARGVWPGCKHDSVLTLVGAQGGKKSTTFAVLAGEWFCSTPLRFSNKDSYITASSSWIVELAELASLKESERAHEVHKAFLSQRTDVYRPPYGTTNEVVARCCAFAGTTNDERILTDRTGNRRHWIADIRNEVADVGRLERDRDQLWGEAVARLAEHESIVEAAREAGEDPVLPGHVRWWLDRDEQTASDKENEDRHVEDAWSEEIASWWQRRVAQGDRGPWRSAQVASGAIGIDASRLDRATEIRLADACRVAGLTRPTHAVTIEEGGAGVGAAGATKKIRARPWSPP